jgi:hypothetical protein
VTAVLHTVLRFHAPSATEVAAYLFGEARLRGPTRRRLNRCRYRCFLRFKAQSYLIFSVLNAKLTVLLLTSTRSRPLAKHLKTPFGIAAPITGETGA